MWKYAHICIEITFQYVILKSKILQNLKNFLKWALWMRPPGYFLFKFCVSTDLPGLWGGWCHDLVAEGLESSLRRRVVLLATGDALPEAPSFWQRPLTRNLSAKAKNVWMFEWRTLTSPLYIKSRRLTTSSKATSHKTMMGLAAGLARRRRRKNREQADKIWGNNI